VSSALPCKRKQAAIGYIRMILSLPWGASMDSSQLRAFATALGLFVAVYAPAFAAVSLIRPPAQGAVPLIIAISLAIALVLIFILARHTAGVSEFGLCIPKIRYVGSALLLGLPLAFAAGWLSHLFPAKGPIDTSAFPRWMLWLYFGVGASIQEEVIFRGLLQSFLQQRWRTIFTIFSASLSPAVLFTATLFGIIHLGSGLIVIAGAFVLGLVAGELRRRSGSLLPAVIVHALFNVPGLLWP
jgi:membrane protease YdiL (CAAX protease family)